MVAHIALPQPRHNFGKIYLQTKIWKELTEPSALSLRMVTAKGGSLVQGESLLVTLLPAYE